MFTFAIVMVFSLWLYWEFYTRAFRPLQYAIAREFPGSSPRVIGGKHKSHKPDAVMTLRVVARVPLEEFDLSMDIPRAEDRARRLAELVLQMEDLSDYEVLQIRLYQRVPEQATRYWEGEHSPNDWAKLAKTGSRLSDEEHPPRDQPSQ